MRARNKDIHFVDNLMKHEDIPGTLTPGPSPASGRGELSHAPGLTDNATVFLAYL